MPTNRRWYQRWPMRRDNVIEAKIIHDNVTTQVTLIDLSRGGAYITNAGLCHGNATFELEIKDSNLKEEDSRISRSCQILEGRAGDDGGCALKFDLPLYAYEVARFTTSGHTHGSLNLAREDYKIVNNEVTHIQGCRSQIFLASLAAISAWLITAIGIGITNNLKSPLWMGIGVSCPYLILTIAILITIEKANAINLRKGFLAALSDYLRADEAPPKYMGWSHLKTNRAECRSRLRAGLCPRNEACWQDVRIKVEHITKNHDVFSHIFDSFMALVSAVYGTFYALATLLGIGLFCYYLSYYPNATLIIIISGLVLGAIITLVGVYLFSQIKTIRKGKKSVESFYLEWVAIMRYCRSIQGEEIEAKQVARGNQVDAVRKEDNLIPEKKDTKVEKELQAILN